MTIRKHDEDLANLRTVHYVCPIETGTSDLDGLVRFMRITKNLNTIRFIGDGPGLEPRFDIFASQCKEAGPMLVYSESPRRGSATALINHINSGD
jgi:hypothetical protein